MAPVDRPSSDDEEAVPPLVVKVTLPTEGAPIFGEKGKRWSIGSQVVAHWWHSTADGCAERSEIGEVVGLLGQPIVGSLEGWTVTVSFGPAFDLIWPTQFAPSQIEPA